MKGIEIKKLEPANPNDNRGMTYEWAKGNEIRQITFCERKKGTLSGNHYHTGVNNPSADPEVNCILDGRVRIIAFDGMEFFDREVFGVSEIRIGKGVLHSYIANNDIIFCERRLEVYNSANPDTHRVDSFKEFIQGNGKQFNEEEFLKYMEVVKQFRA